MISRDELYELVWAEPMLKVAQRFGVSGSYLARVCTSLNVPRPERGYWAKLEFGKAPPKKPLPQALPGDLVHWSKEDEPVPRARPKAPASRTKDRKVRISRTRVHALIRGARPHFERGRPVDDGAYLKPYKKLLVDVTASRAGLDKALDLANDLFNALDSVGHRVVLAPKDAQLRRDRIDERGEAAKPRESWQYSGLWSPYRPTVVFVGTVAIGLAVIETSEEVTMRYINGKYVRESDYHPTHRYRADYSWTTTRELPSGRMRIVAYAPYGQVSWSKQWDETKSKSLRGEIRAIVDVIEAAAPNIVAKLEEAAREAETRHQQWLVEQERRRRDEDRRCIKESIAKSKTELTHVIEKWSEVVGIERFFANLQQRADELPENERIPVLERLALAREFLGSQDPLDFFRDWKTPGELYKPRYPQD
jgi:hypothetical protein